MFPFAATVSPVFCAAGPYLCVGQLRLGFLCSPYLSLHFPGGIRLILDFCRPCVLSLSLPPPPIPSRSSVGGFLLLSV